ncbi:MAG TPA: hypothetical protein VNJ01_17700 [Bacteriovoracaceae bacterium]|nr:hypothetical protein [Bacteriovoracaceae bacterium]
MNIKNCRFLKPFKINGIVLYPFVLYADKDPCLEVMTHEQVHLDQIRKDGVYGFYKRYLKEYFAGRKLGLSHDEAYRNISYEQEAYGKTKPS